MNSIKYFLAFVLLTITTFTLTACSTPVLVKTEYKTETIRVIFLDPPKHWNFDYIRLDDNAIIRDSGKHCSSFRSNAFKVGKVYKVKVRYDTYKGNDGITSVQRVTDGCDFFDQPIVPA